MTDHPSKALLRSRAREALAALTPAERAAASGEICARIRAVPGWEGARVIGLYAAQPTEPDPGALLTDAGSGTGRVFCFPRVAPDGLEFHRWHAAGWLKRGPWNLQEPDPEHCPAVPPEEMDLLLIPGLAFTPGGSRLGRGGGYFDRFLSRANPAATRVGVCFHRQLVDTLPLEEHDHAVGWVVTEAAVIRAGGR